MPVSTKKLKDEDLAETRCPDASTKVLPMTSLRTPKIRQLLFLESRFFSFRSAKLLRRPEKVGADADADADDFKRNELQSLKSQFTSVEKKLLQVFRK